MEQYEPNENGQIELTDEQVYDLQQQVLAHQQMSAGRWKRRPRTTKKKRRQTRRAQEEAQMMQMIQENPELQQ